MTSSHDLLAHPASLTSPDPGRPARPRGRRAATLLAAAAPLAAAALATAPAAAAFATAAPPAAHGHTLAAELLTTTSLPATTAGTACSPCDPKIPALVGD
jgi:hypothetical protein